ncbi:diguanylate cyclase/phosphodiesterase (GGDEF & EAL domains) with PAS/PAC sensor(s) [hydrothermal vent metagenome]|uniref:Diguanylate cyclase/phosphodiesterase (GGDEF & EAL domains) with PAS/PAC sensor(S) n=1 Tax=hydrothermal vent metagenome TaxID=652676 RepID=A0A3B0ZM87_9ZZZZ
MSKNNNKTLKHHNRVNIDLIDSLQRLSDVSNSSSNIEEMMNNSLDELLSIFECDRAWLLHPCDPNAACFDVKMEKARPQWPGACAENSSTAITPVHQQAFEQFLATTGPTIIDTRQDIFAREALEVYSTKTQLSIVIKTRMGKPWLLGLHHCEDHHDFSDDEVMIFNELANRLAESLNGMLALQTARRSEERYRILVEHAPEAILVFDVASERFVDANLNAESLFGLPRANLMDKNFSALSTVLNGCLSATDMMEQQIVRAVGGEICLFEWLFDDASGNSIVCEVRLVRLPSDDGLLLRASISDINERKLSESKMHKLSTALQQTADSVVITDSDGIVEYVNSAYEALTGYTSEEVIGRRSDFIDSGEHDSPFYDDLWATIKSGKLFNDVLINRRKDGVLFYEEKRITPLTNLSGEITHFISTGRDITDRIEAQERLRYMAHHDALTQLPNRSMMMDRLSQAIANARRDGSQVAILFIDLDRFKMINDTLGHDTGDHAIKEVARILLATLRASDTVVRFGGDEFVVLLPEIYSHDKVTQIVNKVQAALTAPIHIEGQELFMSASIGVVLCPDDGDDVNTLLKNADIAMYRAKERGRNRYEFYSSEMGERAYRRLTFETKVRNAVKHEAFELYYQPQLDIASGELVGVEALLRWFPQSDDDAVSEMSPEQFVPVLEETGLILDVGDWVLNTACDQLKSMQQLTASPLRMSVNLSTRQFRDAQLGYKIEQMIVGRGLSPTDFELEITETLLMDNHQFVHDMLNRLSEMGVRLSLDDFGTGYSSLSYLKRFPIDTLKIDRSFVRDISDDPDDRALVTAIIAMARSLKLSTIAEGVETEAQLAFLKSQRCDVAQGFYFSEGVRASELALFLKAQH